MNNRTAIIIVLVALGLLAFITLFERGTLTTDERSERQSRLFAELRRDRITALTLRGSSGEQLALKRQPPKSETAEPAWTIESPRAVRADVGGADRRGLPRAGWRPRAARPRPPGRAGSQPDQGGSPPGRPGRWRAGGWTGPARTGRRDR